jgi:hydroxyacylglutathione hydrolase
VVANSDAEQRPSSFSFAQDERRVHTITDRYSLANTYLINDERVFLVDPGSEFNARFALQYLQQFLHRRPQDVDLIVLTHLHPDHTAGVEYVRGACHVPVAASIIARQIAQSKPQDNSLLPTISHKAGQVLPGVLRHLDLFGPHYTTQARLIDLWLEDVSSLPFHPDWRVIASPGHTPESLCLYNPFSRELLCGDTVITAEGGAPLLGGATNHRQLDETLRTLRSLDVHYLYPGHGRPILSRRPLSNIAVKW